MIESGNKDKSFMLKSSHLVKFKWRPREEPQLLRINRAPLTSSSAPSYPNTPSVIGQGAVFLIYLQNDRMESKKEGQVDHSAVLQRQTVGCLIHVGARV